MHPILPFVLFKASAATAIATLAQMENKLQGPGYTLAEPRGRYLRFRADFGTIRALSAPLEPQKKRSIGCAANIEGDVN